MTIHAIAAFKCNDCGHTFEHGACVCGSSEYGGRVGALDSLANATAVIRYRSDYDTVLYTTEEQARAAEEIHENNRGGVSYNLNNSWSQVLTVNYDEAFTGLGSLRNYTAPQPPEPDAGFAAATRREIEAARRAHERMFESQTIGIPDSSRNGYSFYPAYNNTTFSIQETPRSESLAAYVAREQTRHEELQRERGRLDSQFSRQQTRSARDNRSWTDRMFRRRQREQLWNFTDADLSRDE
jgi:hypothetical protein